MATASPVALPLPELVGDVQYQPPMKENEQLESRILTFVVRDFLANRRAMPRLELILAFENEDASVAVGNLINHNMMRRQDNTSPEQYLPSAASFQFCDDMK